MSALLVGLSLFHVMLVARLDLATVQALLAVASRTQVLLAAAAAGLSTVAFLLLISPISRRRLLRGYDLPNASFADQVIAHATLTFGILLASAFVSAVMILAVIISALSVFVWRRRAQRAGKLSADGKIIVSQQAAKTLDITMITSGAIFVILLLATPWVPKEEVELGEEESLVGYVIGEQSGQILILTPDREATWVSATEIESRRICGSQDESWWYQPVSKLIRHAPYDPCPSDQS